MCDIHTHTHKSRSSVCNLTQQTVTARFSSLLVQHFIKVFRKWPPELSFEVQPLRSPAPLRPSAFRAQPLRAQNLPIPAPSEASPFQAQSLRGLSLQGPSLQGPSPYRHCQHHTTWGLLKKDFFKRIFFEDILFSGLSLFGRSTFGEESIFTTNEDSFFYPYPITESSILYLQMLLAPHYVGPSQKKNYVDRYPSFTITVSLLHSLKSLLNPHYVEPLCKRYRSCKGGKTFLCLLKFEAFH